MKIPKELVLKLVSNACYKYADVDMGISSCLERFFLDDLRMDEDDAFDIASDIADEWVKIY